MQSLSASEFPVFNGSTIDENSYFETKQDDLKDLVSKVVFCCATDESRPILKGCLLETVDGKLTATALDGFRMACSICEAGEGSGEGLFDFTSWVMVDGAPMELGAWKKTDDYKAMAEKMGW